MSVHKSQVRFLYKTILRLHRSLPDGLRQLGDEYVKDEFRRHKNIAPEHVSAFMMEWSNYCATLAKQVGLKGPKTASKFGKPLEIEKLDQFEDQQIHQLYELKTAIIDDTKIDNISNTAKTKP